MKKITALFSMMMIFLLTACAQGNVNVSHTGGINPTKWKGGESATVSISHIPTTVEEFEALQAQLGTTPEGAVMLQLVAFEMYRNDKIVGAECVKLNNTDTNIPSVMRRLPEIFRQNDSYARPHLVATYFKGSTPQNGFNPAKPYTVEVRSHKTRQYERSQSLKGYVLYLEVYSSGYDSHWRGCEVVKQKGSEYYKVSNSPSLYVQCQEVPFDSDRDFEGL